MSRIFQETVNKDAVIKYQEFCKQVEAEFHLLSNKTEVKVLLDKGLDYSQFYRLKLMELLSSLNDHEFGMITDLAFWNE